MNAVEKRVRDFIGKTFVMADAEGLASDQSLLAARLIDSTGVLELVGFIEEQFQVRINDDELVPENLDTIANIVAYIERKTGGGEAHD